MYKLFLTLRYLRKRRIAFFAVLSVWLCVAMEVIVISVMGGFLDTLKERSRGLLSDIVIDNDTLQGFPLYDEFVAYLREAMPGRIQAASPVIYNYGILRDGETSKTKPVRAVGIRLREYMAVNDFQNSLFYDKYYPGTTTLAPQQQPVAAVDETGNVRLPPDHEEALARWRQAHPDAPEFKKLVREPWSLFPGPGVFMHTLDGLPGYDTEGDAAPGIIVGFNILFVQNESGQDERFIPRGRKFVLSLLPLTRKGNLSGEGAVTVITRMADDSRTRVYEIDDLCVYIDFDLLQEWMSMTAQELEGGGVALPRASQILIALAPGSDAQEARVQIAEHWDRFVRQWPDPLTDTDRTLLSFVQAETWQERQAPFIRAVEKEKILVTLLFAVISLVAVVLIGCIFWMIVTQKTKDIGVLKSVGASASGVATIFIGFGAAVGILGAVLGVVSGSVFVHYINDIQDLLTKLHPQLRVWSPDVYTFDRIPNAVKGFEAAAIAVVAVFASVLGAVIPAIIAGRVWPVAALRYE